MLTVICFGDGLTLVGGDAAQAGVNLFFVSSCGGGTASVGDSNLGGGSGVGGRAILGAGINRGGGTTLGAGGESGGGGTVCAFQFMKSSCSLVIYVSCFLWSMAEVSLNAEERKLRASTMQSTSMTVGWLR